MHEFFRQSKTDLDKPDERYMARPNHLPHYRDIQLPKGDEGPYDRFPTLAVTYFTWPKIENLAFQNPPAIKVPKEQFFGRNQIMDNVSALHQVFGEFLQKRYDCQRQERQIIHSDLYDNNQNTQAHYLVILTDMNGNVAPDEAT